MEGCPMCRVGEKVIFDQKENKSSHLFLVQLSNNILTFRCPEIACRRLVKVIQLEEKKK